MILMKIGIFGGSFNPVHKMHIDIVMYLLKHNYVDKVIFVPTGIKYEYKNNLIDNNYRYEMLKLVCENNMDVSDYEFKDKVVYTCETLKYFKDANKNDEIYFICGADNLSYIDKWKNGLDILKEYKVLVINREGNDTGELLKKYRKYKDNIIIVPMVMNGVSSTIIRKKIENNENVDEFVDNRVVKYISDNELYKRIR
jgi:nicotinate-nucleotide adenylyltransferase